MKRWLVSVVTLVLAGAASWPSVSDALEDGIHHPGRVLAILAWALTATVGGIVPVSQFLSFAGCRAGNDAAPNRWMGVVERAAIFSLLLLDAPKAIGGFLLLKTAIRWPRLEEATKDDHFAEAFFLSMFFNLALSAACAVAAGADLSNLP